MTDGGDPDVELTCAACGTSGPPGSYCPSCGSRFGRHGRHGHPVAPNEQVLLPSVVTSLFPRLAAHARRPFRIALVAVLAALIVSAVLRWQAPVVVLATFGFALLFTAYLAESDVFHDFPRKILALAAVLGVAIGVAWGTFAGRMVSRSYDVPLGTGPDHTGVLAQGVAMAAVGVLVMLLPTVVVALTRPDIRESLDGYVIGALSATYFMAAATVARLAPQLAAGPTTVSRSTVALLVEAGIHGFAMPLLAAALGGLFGLALWFRRRLDGGVEWRFVAAAVAVAVVLVGVLRALEILVLRQWVQLVIHLVIAVIALSAARFGARYALLNEALDPTEPVACPDCGPAEPGTRFCTDCGVALRAFSRTARTGRTTRTAPGTRRRLALAVGIGVSLLAVAAVGVSTLVTARPARYVCPPDCGAPPIGTPIETNPQFVSADGHYSVSYPGQGTAYRPTFTDNGVVLDFVAGDTGTLELHGEAANGRNPQQVAEELLRRHYPDATIAYEIPNASVGYQPGFGVAADYYPQDGNGTYTRLRILVLAAVKNDYALVAGAVGPYHEFSPSFGNGHPSGANLQLALDMAKYVNSFAWRGDSPR